MYSLLWILLLIEKLFDYKLKYVSSFFSGLTISGAITLAINEINSGKLNKLGHSLEFVVAETYGEEVTSIKQTAALWTNQTAGYIGPQETCVHEGRMAAAFNLPMISYVCYFICNILIVMIKYNFFFFNFSSFVHIVIHHAKRIFLHLLVHVHPIHKYQNQLLHYYSHLIGHK